MTHKNVVRNPGKLRVPVSIMPDSHSCTVLLDTPLFPLTSHLTAKFSSTPIKIVHKDRILYPHFYSHLFSSNLMLYNKYTDEALVVENAALSNQPAPEVFRLAILAQEGLIHTTQYAIFGAAGTFEENKKYIEEKLEEHKGLSEKRARREKDAYNNIMRFNRKSFGKGLETGKIAAYNSQLAELEVLQGLSIALRLMAKDREKLTFSQAYSNYLQTPMPAAFRLALLVYPQERRSTITIYYAAMPKSAGMEPCTTTSERHGKTYKIRILPYSKEKAGIELPEGTPALLVLGKEQHLLTLKDEFAEDLPRILGIKNKNEPESSMGISSGATFALPKYNGGQY